MLLKCKKPFIYTDEKRVDAWAAVLDNGGSVEEAQEAERNEIKLIRQEKDEADLRNFKAFEQLMLEGREIRRQKELEAGGGGGGSSSGDIDADDQAGAELDEVNPFSGEKIIHVPESEELRLARETRWNAPLPPVSSSLLLKQQQEAAIATAEVASTVVSEDVDVMSGASNIELWKSIYREAMNEPTVEQQLGIIEEKATADSHAVDENHHHLSTTTTTTAAAASTSQSTIQQLSEKKSKFMSLLTESIEEVSLVNNHHPTTTTAASTKNHDMEELD